MLKLFESSDAKSIYKICNFLDGIITEFPHEIHDYSWILFNYFKNYLLIKDKQPQHQIYLEVINSFDHYSNLISIHGNSYQKAYHKQRYNEETKKIIYYFHNK